jgi:riboflavin biosynthesis pyrimidine reductase
VRRLFPEPTEGIDPVDAYADLPPVEDRPVVRVNMIASVDGATAVDGVSGGLGGPADRRVYLVLRALADVVLVAAGTVRAEGYGPPALPEELAAARRRLGLGPGPRVAVVSGSLDLDWGSDLFARADPKARPIVLTTSDAPPRARARAAAVAQVVVAGEGSVDLGRALAALGEGGARSVLAEGGPSLNRALAAAGLIDELCLTVSPRLVAGDSRRILAGPAVASGGIPLRLRSVCEEEGMLFLRYRARAGA